MSELQLPGRAIADGVDAAVGGFQPLVHCDAGAVVFDPGGGEIEPIGRRLTPGGDKEISAFDRFLVTCALISHRNSTARVLDVYDLYAAADDDAFAFKLIEHDGGAFWIVFGQRSRRFEHRHITTEPTECLRHFQTDRTGANNNEAIGLFGEIENGFVSKIRPLVYPWNRRQRRRRFGRNHETSRADFNITHGDGSAVLEFGGAFNHAHAQAGKALSRVGRRDCGNHALYVIVHLAEVDINF